MKRLLLLSLIGFHIYAGDLQSYNLKKTDEQNVSGRIETYIVTPEKSEITVVSDSVLTIEQEDFIGRTFTNFYNWPELNITSSKIVIDKSKMSIILNIGKFIYKNINLAEFMPSGIQIYYDTFFEYDFRMFKDSLFMRLKGQFYTKEEFLEELFKAVNNPLLYVQIHDPSYMIKQIDLLRLDNTNQDKELKELLENYTDLLEKHNDLLEKHNILQSELLTQTDVINTLKSGIISLNNRSLFGSLNTYDKTQIDEVVKIKTENLQFTTTDVLNVLKETNIKISEKIIDAVFIVYFNEFPQNYE